MNCRPQCEGDTIIRHRTSATSKKKKCRKKKQFDCIDEEKLEEQENKILKITYQKCKEDKKKSGEKKYGPLTTIKCVPFSEMVMNRIKPSMATREKFLAARHLDCILGKVRTVDLAAIREELKRPRLLKRLCSEPVDRKRKRKKKKKKKGREKEKEKEEEAKRAKSKSKDSTGQQDEAASDVQPESEDASDGKESDESEKRPESREVSESKDSDDKPKVSSASRGSSESKDAKSGDSRAKSKNRKRAHPDKFWCEKLKKPVKEAPSYMSEAQFDKCESVCSFDSDVCLAGLSLTVKDKKAIAENRERVRGSSKNNEAKNDAAKK